MSLIFLICYVPFVLVVIYYWYKETVRRTRLSRYSHKDPLRDELTTLDSLRTIRRYTKRFHFTLSGTKCYPYYWTDSQFEHHGIAFGECYTFGVTPTNEDVVAVRYIKLFCEKRLALLHHMIGDPDCSRLITLYIHHLLEPIEWYGIHHYSDSLYLCTKDGSVPFYSALKNE